MRDARDKGRAVAPLVAAESAAVLDTSAMDREAAIAAAIAIVQRLLPGVPASRR
jgi:cytidylate kinase